MDIILNNGKDVVKKIEENDFPKEVAIAKMDENGTFKMPNITDSNIKKNAEFITNLFDSSLNETSQNTITENDIPLTPFSLANFIKSNNIKPEMRLYGVDENYFESIDELLKYCRQNQFSMQCLIVLDYYRNFYDCKDVIRKTNGEISMFYAISNERGYLWYGDELNMDGENWKFNHGQIKSLYKPFRDHGIVFEDDVYAKELERDQHILKYCRKKRLFNMGKKDNE